MAVKEPNSTSYTHPDEPNLLDLRTAMDYNNDGEPVVRIDGTVQVESNPTSVLPAGYGSIHKFGEVQALSGSTTGTVWDRDDTIYPWAAIDSNGTLTVEVVLPNNENNIRSDDDGATVTLSGLDTNFEAIEETVTIANGTATTTNSFRRIFRAYFTDSTSFNPTSNRILIKSGGTSGTVVAQITEDFGQTLMSVYTIPSGYTGYLMRLDATCLSSGQLSLYIRPGGSDSFRIQHRALIDGAGGQYIVDYPVPQPLPEHTDIDVRATAGDNNSNITATFDIMLKPNT